MNVAVMDGHNDLFESWQGKFRSASSQRHCQSNYWEYSATRNFTSFFDLIVLHFFKSNCEKWKYLEVRV